MRLTTIGPIGPIGPNGPVTPPVADRSPRADGRPKGRRWVTVLIVLIGLVIVAMWVYAFFFASKKAAYRVYDNAWRTHAEQTCAGFEAQRLTLVDTSGGYIAHPTHEQMQQRADVVDQATNLLQAELDQITALPADNARDQSLIDKYHGYYDTLIADRRAYTARLRRFELQPYRETTVGGDPVSNIIVDFTTVNQIPKCTPPGELGGDI